MEPAAIDGIEIAYELQGSGEPVVLIHWGVSARWAEPLLAEPILAERYRLLRYHRVGYGRSSRVEGPITMADHAEHCRLLMRQLGIERAHVVGHSSSALIAVQQWAFTETDARRISQPVLAVVGQNSAPTFRERRDLLLAWLPRVKPFDVPGATHLLHIERPHEVAEALYLFFARHPFEASS
jgi:pimeloyl-ACP methyl ester carboxylesterase